MKKNSLYLLFLMFLGIMPTLISSFITYLLYANNTLLSNCNTLEIIIFFSLASFTMALALTPTTFITILAGYFFSWPGLIGIFVSYMFASVLGLLMGKGLQRFGIKYRPKAGSKFEKLLNNFGDREFMLIAFARLSPVLPFAMTNVALSAIRLRWNNYLLGSVTGMFPRTFLFFWAGKNAKDIWNLVRHPSLSGIGNMVPVLFIVVSTLGIYWVVNKKFYKEK